jgi:tetratricopeptide (TPR) repeat protein
MQRWARPTLSGVAVVGLAAGLLAVGTAAGAPPDVAPAPAAVPAGRSAQGQSVEQLQRDLERLPGNWSAWAALGLAYVEQARVTADPTLYARGDGAFAESLELRPQDNDAALAGQATLAAARHDFAEALALTDRALAVNAYSPTTWAVRSDALTELGRYDEARDAVQRLLDLSPDGIDGLTRASYALELRGDVEGARAALEQAAQEAGRPADVAFAQQYLGELAWNEGDLPAARAAYEAGLAADPTSLALQAGRAEVVAAEGDTAAAVADLREVVERLPAPEHLVTLGELLEATGAKQEAQEQYAVVRATQRLYAANGQDVDSELALFEADHGDPATAVQLAARAHAARPDSVHVQDAHAWALHRAGRSAEALPLARAAARLGLRSPSFAYHLGAVEAAAGDPAAARTALRRALDLNPTFSPLHAPRAAALLERLGG